MPEQVTPDMALRVTRAEPIAEGIHLFEFRRPDGGELPPFTAGAHIQVRVPNGLIRKFSLCSDPADRHAYAVAVKRESEGRGGSISLIDNTKTGDTLMVSKTVNDFGLPQRGDNFIFIAGGIGVTPMIAMIHELKNKPEKKFKLYYLGRSLETMAFRNELSAPELKDSVVIHCDDGDPSKSYDLSAVVAERKNREHLYCCGPRGLMSAVREMTAHWTPTSIHMEAFSDADARREGDTAFTVKLAKSNDVVEVPVGVTIMEAMRAKGYEVPSSCETGTCGTCKVKMLAGEADHRDLFLTEKDRADNIMICVSRAKTAELVLDR
jgi:phthalate 4,5-dioxygenase reductase subunit